MKAERLLSILTLLLNRKKLSAAFLARHFGVSVRTIYRDVDALAETGIPIFATLGRDGGFELVEGFTLDKQLLDTSDMQRIISILGSLTPISHDPGIEGLTEKLKLALENSRIRGIKPAKGYMFIELTPSRFERHTIGLLEKSIEGQTVLSIQYQDSQAQHTSREIEPLALVFIWQSWFVYAWCRLRKDFRLFRVSRIRQLEPLKTRRLVPLDAPGANLEQHPWNKEWEKSPFVELVFEADLIAESRIIEFFGIEAIEHLEAQNGAPQRIRVRTSVPTGEWVESFLMSLPGDIRIIAPESFQKSVCGRAARILYIHENS